MKKQFKLATLALALVVTATTSMAADFDTNITDIDSVHALAQLEMAVGFGENTAVQNVGLLSQTGDLNIAYVNQTGAGNFTAIIQNATTAAVANVAYVFQDGNSNRGVFYQH
jgi:hypothetical protein